MLLEEKILRKVIALLNDWPSGYETELLEQFADWCNNNLITPYKIIKVGNFWTVRIPIK